jgi:hypothetical protein
LYANTDEGRAKGKSASQSHYNRERMPKIKSVEAAIESWGLKPERFKAAHDWKEWVAGAAVVPKAFITRAVTRSDIIPPISR